MECGVGVFFWLCLRVDRWWVVVLNVNMLGFCMCRQMLKCLGILVYRV